MNKFIKAKDEQGEEMLINLNLVSVIRLKDNGYILSLLGSRFSVEGKSTEIERLISSS